MGETAFGGNMALDIKICGLKTPETIAAALQRGASHLGLIHFNKSPRHVELGAMAALRSRIGARARVVVVTVDPDDALLDAIAAEVAPDMIQLHGAETPGRVAETKARTGLPVMKAISIASAADIAKVEGYRQVADRILLDAKRPAGSLLPGGNGVAFDWGLLGALDPSLRYMLSGGVNAGNVGEAIGRVRPSGLDISSGVESSPGIKDLMLIHGFFDAVHAAVGTLEQERRAS